MAGDKSSTLDLKVMGDIAPRVGFFARSRLTMDYQGNSSNFTIGQVSYTLVDSLDATLGAQAGTGVDVTPRAGFQYATNVKDVKVAAAVTGILSEKTQGELLGRVTYLPQISDGVKAYLQVESISTFAKEGHVASVQRCRAGVDVDGLQLGAAADLKESGNQGKFTYNVGGFIGKTF